MRKSRFTESQIVTVLKEVEGGRTVTEVYRECDVPKEFLRVLAFFLDRRWVNKEALHIDSFGT